MGQAGPGWGKEDHGGPLYPTMQHLRNMKVEDIGYEKG